MKKSLFYIATLFLLTTNTFADTASTQSSTSNNTSINTNQTAKMPAASKDNKTDEGSSVGDVLQRGWNKFIDLLAGPAKN